MKNQSNFGIQYPNRTYILDIIKETGFGKRKHIVLVAADSPETAAMYLKDKLGFDGVPNDLKWMMNANYPTIYDQRGNVHEIQAKILYNAVALLKEL